MLLYIEKRGQDPKVRQFILCQSIFDEGQLNDFSSGRLEVFKAQFELSKEDDCLN